MTDTKKLGRPPKGKDRRIELSVYVAGSTVAILEEYLAERQATERGYSRSDFFNEALEKHMADLGLLEGSEERRAPDGQEQR
jgi:hypothetical protein